VEARRSKRQEGVARVWSERRNVSENKKMPVYDRSIKVLEYPGQTKWRPGEKLGFRI
jgi:hypothetical protein